MSFEINIPENLSFHDYIAIIQTARAWADGYDRKDESRLLAALAKEVTINYSFIVPAWGEMKYTDTEFAKEWLSSKHLGLKPLATQHLLGQPYFKRVEPNEIIVEWQQLASHGRRADEIQDASAKITETSDGRSYMEHRFIKVDGKWKISGITPSLIYQTGDFARIRRPEDEE